MDNNINSATYDAVQSAKLLLGKMKLEGHWTNDHQYDHNRLVSYLKAMSFEARVVASMGEWVLEKGYYTFVSMPKTADVIEQIESGKFDEERELIGWVDVRIREDTHSDLPNRGFYNRCIITNISTGYWKEA